MCVMCVCVGVQPCECVCIYLCLCFDCICGSVCVCVVCVCMGFGLKLRKLLETDYFKLLTEFEKTLPALFPLVGSFQNKENKRKRENDSFFNLIIEEISIYFIN